MWVRRADKAPAGDISQVAVAKVIADHLQAIGQLPSDDIGAYRALKDRVNRALSGQALTPSTLRLFAQAFLFSQDDALQLWSYFLGTTHDDAAYLLDDLRLPPRGAAAFRPRGYQVISLAEVHVLGPDGAPNRHTTKQIIRATSDSLTRCPVRFDTDTLAISVPDGSASDLYACPDGMYAIDIIFPHSLHIGEEREVHYTLHYSTRTPDRQRFRRSALHHSIDEASIEVRFSPQCRPSTVWWAIWQQSEESPSLREPVQLSAERNSVVKTVMFAARTIFGFCWDW